jgi:alcohol oxidase
MYTRAQRHDLDSFNTEGWNSKELMPYLKKIEKYLGPGSKDVHGDDGPVTVSYGTFRSETAAPEFIRALDTLGHRTVEDLQDLDTNNAASTWLRTVCPDGKRQDTASRYLHKKMDNPSYPNLHILTESKVVRVLLDDNKRAVGVEYTPSSGLQPAGLSTGTPTSPHKQIKARKLVVVSCGAIGTPPVLQRSGVGDPAVLKRAGIDVKVDLPGVGTDYQDHHLILYPYVTSLPAEETIDSILRNPDSRPELFKKKDPRLGWNGIDMSSKLRPSDDEVKSLSPALQKRFQEDFQDEPNRPIMLMAMVNGFLGDPMSVPEATYVTVGNYTAYPYSRGHVYVTGPNADDPIDFDCGFLNDQDDVDLEMQVWAYKKSRDAIRRTSMFRGELAAGHPAFSESSTAACQPASGPSTEPIKYSAEDDKAIAQWVRENVNTTWHSIGTAKMAPQNKGGVVDKDLNVHGTSGLKLADLSVLPMNVGANTNNTAMMVGEKAADIIIKELGLQQPTARI